MPLTIWFHRKHAVQVRAVWAGIYSAKLVRRAQWSRALRISIETIAAVAPMVEDKDTRLYIEQQLNQLALEVENWRRE
jgi:recombinational DNA repair protein RecR